uniref:Cytochrome c oxidase subunit 3 n=1 Tax=Endeis sp. JZ-2022 TaxID=2992007 RepID=A0A9E7V7A5_9CHEL|nr:cytochrome c oxidase subunit 3 [Endeis sp. JZ-2022]
MTKQFHPYHIVNQSPWPLTSSISAMLMASGLIEFMYMKTYLMITTGAILMLVSSLQWWRDITREATLQGHHSIKVVSGMRWGMLLFITSEVLLFSSFFWAFFHSSLSPAVEIGMKWPPIGVSSFNPLMIPLLNTLILLSSGVTITYSHHSIMNNMINKASISLFMTIILGFYFSLLQAWEYWTASFTMSDSVFGSSFFVATGFHGLHVLIGSLFLVTNLIRMVKTHFSMNHHFGFEAAIWYWHFVDVVWLFLYISIYWWSS